MQPQTRRDTWLAELRRLVDLPLSTIADRRGFSDMPIVGKGGVVEGDTKRIALLECVGRIACGVAPWLESKVPVEAEQRNGCTALLAAAIESVVDPDSPDFPDVTTNPQALVDLAFLAQALLRSPHALTGALTASARSYVIDACRKACAATVPGQNNWLLFSACCQALLRKWGEEHQPTIIDYGIQMHAGWYLYDGTYGDGPQLHWDYYNSYVIQPMMLDILLVDEGTSGPAPRWYNAIDPDTARQRLTRWAEVQERLISGDGSYPPLGRSIAYRSGAFHGLAAAALHHLLPETVCPSQVRCALQAVHDKTLGNPGSYDASGWLTIGVAGHQPGLGEGYITTGSLYLTSASFLPLGLSADDPFWAGPDVQWTARRFWAGEDMPADHAKRD